MLKLDAVQEPKPASQSVATTSTSTSSSKVSVHPSAIRTPKRANTELFSSSPTSHLITHMGQVDAVHIDPAVAGVFLAAGSKESGFQVPTCEIDGGAVKE